VAATISTHVLDTGRGEPAAGVRVRLRSAEGLVGEGVTDAAGRVADLAGPLAPGEYRLTFEVGAERSELYRAVHLDVTLADGHHHLPLLLSGFGCTAYRGS
jgi:5-hydroxyisourate hydrolase